MSFAAFQAEDRRLTILRALESSVQYRANAMLLRRYCDHLGHVVSADKLAADLAWLAEAELLTLQHEPGVAIATLTTRGVDVATGRAVHPGVQRPAPGG